ncbi:DNA internalization-related competence protein ComEC/Rec2 [Duganella fentianensis]|uniref:DNA internalization-related competence protein ComEC/Rec2 n=1 Tax=Duganella fentianensis TaxID=2692177 RepID=UPI0032B2212B
MRLFCIGFVAGAALLQQQSALPTWSDLLLTASAGSLTVLLWRWQFSPARYAVMRQLLTALASVITGYCWAALLAHQALQPFLHGADEGRDLRVSGVVESLPYPSGAGQRFNFHIEQVLSPTAAELPARIALGWYAGNAQQGGVPLLRAGQRWQLTVRLQRPHGNANPYGFDYEVWLLEQGIRATGYVRATDTAVLIDSLVPCGGCVVDALRGAVRSRIEAALAGRRYSAVMVALVVGDQHGIRPSDWLVFTRTGVSHLISISGLHVTMVAGLAAMLASQLWRRSFFTAAQLPLILPARRVAALVGALAAWAYVLLAGYGVPAQRTLYMLLVVALAIWQGRITRFSHVLAAALFLVVLLDPWAVIWPGFWLSFGAVAVLVYAGSGRLRQRAARSSSAGTSRAALQQSGSIVRRWYRLLAEAALAQYAVTIGLVPLTVLLFAQISLVTPLANALAIPLVSIIIAPLALLASVMPQPVSTALLELAHALFGWLADVLIWLSRQPQSVWRAPMPAPLLFCWATLGTLWLLAPRGWPVRWLGLASWLPLLFAPSSAPRRAAMQVTFFDVGQGMAVLVETQHHRLLYDAGPAYGSVANAGNRIILPYLQARGIATLDRLMISHSDTDHAGGALALLAAMPELALWSSLPPWHAVRRAARTAVACQAGQQWDWDGVHFEMLAPPAGSYGQPGLKPNALSCSLKISTLAGTLLLVGDIEAAQELAMLGSYGQQLRASVLLAPHHGSKTSSGVAFLQAVQPRHAIFQLGYRNRYHHPHPAVWERYGGLGITRWRTDLTGAIELRFDDEIQLTAYRQRHARYWYGR